MGWSDKYLSEIIDAALGLDTSFGSYQVWTPLFNMVIKLHKQFHASVHKDTIQREYRAFDTKHCMRLQFFSNIIPTSGFEVNSQTSNLGLILYYHLSITPSSQYLIPPTDPSIRIIPFPPSSSVGQDNTEQETAPRTANSIQVDNMILLKSQRLFCGTLNKYHM